MKPKRKNRTYNPVLLLFYTIMYSGSVVKTKI